LTYVQWGGEAGVGGGEEQLEVRAQ
jgi:hypothetical protein